MSPTAEVADNIENGVNEEDNTTLKTPEQSSSSVPSRRNNLYALAIFVACAVVLAVVIPTAIILGTNDDDDNDDVIKEILGTDDDDNDNIIKESSSFVAIDGALPANLTLFGEGIVGKNFTDPALLQEDLENVARFMLSVVVKRNTNTSGFENAGIGRQHPGRFVSFNEAISFAESPEDFESTALPTSDTARPQVGDTIDDFGTNNQEENIEEGDLIVSDGEKVYAAYGDYIVVWNANLGEIVANVKMPTIEETEERLGLVGDRRRASSIYPGNYKPSIKSLALQEGKLLVIVEGYGSLLSQNPSMERDYPILYDYGSTHARVYETSVITTGSTGEVGTLPFKGSIDLNGRFSAVRIIDGNAHIVTTSGIDTYTDLVAPFERSSFDKSLTDAEYIDAVKVLAEDTYIKKWTAAITEELKVNGMLPNLPRISLFQTEVSSDSDVELLLSAEGLVNSLAQVFSLNLEDATNFLDSDNISGVSASGAFLPSYYAEVYAAPKTLIIAGQGQNYDINTQTSKQMTYLIGLAINDDSTVPTSVGTVEGHVLNPYSIDVVGNTLRIATTSRDWWRVRFVGETSALEEVESSTQNYIRTIEMPGLDGDKPGTMVERGSVRLGKPDEVFTVVRFFDSVAYAATFEKRDPFYALDLSDVNNPKVLGELDISGFSTYLHSMNDDNTLLLAIGQDADDEGGSLGLQLTVFDARDPANLRALTRFSYQNGGSQGEWDFKAVRYVREIERLIIPVNIYNWEVEDSNFNGFIVFVVNEETIEEDCRIAERLQTNGYIGRDICYYCAYLPPRSMIFDGNLMTVRNHFVQSTDLDTCDNVWRLEVQIEDETTNFGCCY